ncbi:neuropeptide Y receptor type 2-like [Heterodontus francisci]|uniref:neuropeptide Y receptor type 2-like n=1 Tax=Heterodontus francisci TaxID=7792 RepID=UPI00355C3832
METGNAEDAFFGGVQRSWRVVGLVEVIEQDYPMVADANLRYYSILTKEDFLAAHTDFAGNHTSNQRRMVSVMLTDRCKLVSSCSVVTSHFQQVTAQAEGEQYQINSEQLMTHPTSAGNGTEIVDGSSRNVSREWHSLTIGQSRNKVYQSMAESTKLLSVQITLITAYALIILLGLVGNSLVIYMIVKYKTMRTVTNFFIANLALADLMVDTLCLPFTLVYTLLGEWKLGAVLCHLVPYAQALSVHVSTLTLTVIALDRHRCIVFHLDSRISKKSSFITISMTWLVSAVLAGPLAIFREYKLVDLKPINLQIVVCSEKWPSGNTRDGTIYSISMFILQYVLPLAIISYAYIRIWIKLKNHVSPCARSDSHYRRRKTTKMLVMVVVVFAVCWLPLHIFQLVSDLDKRLFEFTEYKLLYTIFHVVAMCSTFANPLLYGWMNKNYRNGFIRFFRCSHNVDNLNLETSVKVAPSPTVYRLLKPKVGIT